MDSHDDAAAVLHAQHFETWRVEVCRAAVAQGMSVKITDDHWDWFRARFDEGHAANTVVALAQDAELS